MLSYALIGGRVIKRPIQVSDESQEGTNKCVILSSERMLPLGDPTMVASSRIISYVAHQTLVKSGVNIEQRIRKIRS